MGRGCWCGDGEAVSVGTGGWEVGEGGSEGD